MSHRISAKERTFFPEIASMRLKLYANENNLTIKGRTNCTKLAEHLSMDRRVISDIIKGTDKAYNYDTFKQFQQNTGIPADYWTGKSPYKTIQEEQEQKRIEGLFAELELRQQKELNQTVEKLSFFFASLGYKYSYALDWETDQSHQLTSFNEPDKHYYFNQEELDDLISRMKDMVDLACFRKEQATQRAEEGGNQNGD